MRDNREYNMPRNSVKGNAIPKAPRNINLGHSCVWHGGENTPDRDRGSGTINTRGWSGKRESRVKGCVDLKLRLSLLLRWISV